LNLLVLNCFSLDCLIYLFLDLLKTIFLDLLIFLLMQILILILSSFFGLIAYLVIVWCIVLNQYG